MFTRGLTVVKRYGYRRTPADSEDAKKLIEEVEILQKQIGTERPYSYRIVEKNMSMFDDELFKKCPALSSLSKMNKNENNNELFRACFFELARVMIHIMKQKKEEKPEAIEIEVEKQLLQDMSKEELISMVQDYQETFNGVESCINEMRRVLYNFV